MEEWEDDVGRDKGMSDEDKNRYCPVLVATLLWRLSELSVAYFALICTAQAPKVGWNE